ncbi:hypothetical protein CPC16_003696, partial [Podila verticillata]
MTTYNSTDNSDKWQHEIARSNLNAHALDPTSASVSPYSAVAPSSQTSSPVRPTWKQRVANLCSRKFLTILLLGQLL